MPEVSGNDRFPDLYSEELRWKLILNNIGIITDSY
jgi:hypothetical protein